MIELKITHKHTDWLICVTDYDYESGEPESRHSPGCPEIAVICDGYVQIDIPESMEDIIFNKFLKDGTNNNIFINLVQMYNEELHDQLLETIHDRQEAEEAAYFDSIAEDIQDREDTMNAAYYEGAIW